tara:strand:- start:877 stop:1548 length:672 start_codon:yes stop_codon:yes gene_type:complete
MGFKMKGNPFKLGRVATKSGMQMAKRAMKMKSKSPMTRLDYEYDGEIIDKVTYDQKMDEAQVLADLARGGTGVRDEEGDFMETLTIYSDEDQAIIKSFFPDFMTEEEFNKANPNAKRPNPNTTAYAEYFKPFAEKLKVEAKKQLQDKYAPREGSKVIVGDVGFSDKLKATGQDFIDELYQEFKKSGPSENADGSKITFQQYIDNAGLREQYQKAVRERNADKQ